MTQHWTIGPDVWKISVRMSACVCSITNKVRTKQYAAKPPCPFRTPKRVLYRTRQTDPKPRKATLWLRVTKYILIGWKGSFWRTQYQGKVPLCHWHLTRWTTLWTKAFIKEGEEGWFLEQNGQDLTFQCYSRPIFDSALTAKKARNRPTEKWLGCEFFRSLQ